MSSDLITTLWVGVILPLLDPAQREALFLLKNMINTQ